MKVTKSNEKKKEEPPESWREPGGSDTMLTTLQKMKNWYKGRGR